MLKAIQTEPLSRDLKVNGLGLKAHGLGFKRTGVTQVLEEDNDILAMTSQNFFANLAKSLAASLRILYRLRLSQTHSYPSIRTKSQTGQLKKKEAKGTEIKPFFFPPVRAIK